MTTGGSTAPPGGVPAAPGGRPAPAASRPTGAPPPEHRGPAAGGPVFPGGRTVSVGHGSPDPVSAPAPGPAARAVPPTVDDPERRLRAPAHRVAPRAIRWWTVRSALGGIAVLLPQLAALAVVTAAGLDGTVLVVSGALTVVAGLAHLLVVPRWRYRVHRWEATPEAVHTLAGWLSREWRIAPVARIQTVDTDQGPLQRAFDLSTVTVTTASSAGALRIEGLRTADARRLAHDLTAAAHAAGGDAT